RLHWEMSIGLGSDSTISRCKKPAPLVGYRTDAEGPFLVTLETHIVPWGRSWPLKVGTSAPETVRSMQVALDLAWSSLSPEEQAQSSRTLLGTRILDAAEAGERSPARLVMLALMSASGS